MFIRNWSAIFLRFAACGTVFTCVIERVTISNGFLQDAWWIVTALIILLKINIPQGVHKIPFNFLAAPNWSIFSNFLQILLVCQLLSQFWFIFRQLSIIASTCLWINFWNQFDQNRSRIATLASKIKHRFGLVFFGDDFCSDFDFLTTAFWNVYFCSILKNYCSNVFSLISYWFNNIFKAFRDSFMVLTA